MSKTEAQFYVYIYYFVHKNEKTYNTILQFHVALLVIFIDRALQEIMLIILNGLKMSYQGQITITIHYLAVYKKYLYVGIAPYCPRCSKQNAGEGESPRFGTLWVLSAARHRL